MGGASSMALALVWPEGKYEAEQPVLAHKRLASPTEASRMLTPLLSWNTGLTLRTR